MGNRAVITESTDPKAPCIYLHWNGGRASVEGFLAAARQTGQYSGPSAVARMDKLAAQLARQFFECEIGKTVHRFPYGEADSDNGDNGAYIIDSSGHIVGREYYNGPEETDPEKTEKIRADIVAKHAIDAAASTPRAAETASETCHAVELTLQDGARWFANIRAAGPDSAMRKANAIKYEIAGRCGRAEYKALTVAHGMQWPRLKFARINNNYHVRGSVYQWINTAHAEKRYR